jgi:hypothetical protein
MSIFGSPAPISTQSAIAGAAQAEQVRATDANRQRPVRPPAAPRRAGDSFEQDVSGAEAIDAVRDLKGNDQEESRQDRREHDGYSATAGQDDGDRRPPHIDVSA